MKTILFLCRHNKSRSQYAEAYFNHSNADPKLRALSAGTTPITEDINPLVQEILDEKGIDSTGLKPKRLTSDMLSSVDYIISMGCNVDCGLFEFPVNIAEDWPLEDPHEQSKETAQEICEQIEERVHKLHQDLHS